VAGGRGLGWAALIFTVLVWASYLVAARAAVVTAFTPVELGVIRFLPGALVLLPLALRGGGRRRTPRRMRDAMLIAVFGGILFVPLLTSGFRFAPAADGGMFTPAMLPVFMTLLGLALGESLPAGFRLAGLGLILGGALAIGGWEALARTGSGAWRGHLLFLCASLSWAIYTFAYRRSGFGAVESTAVMCIGASVVFVPLALATGADFLRHGWGPLLLHVLLQGVFSGFLATFTYFVAIARLGTQPPAAFAALVPGLGAVLAWLFLDEPLGPLKLAGLAVISLGVALASGALSAPGKRI